LNLTDGLLGGDQIGHQQLALLRERRRLDAAGGELVFEKAAAPVGAAA